jgi:hypothetical protein
MGLAPRPVICQLDATGACCQMESPVAAITLQRGQTCITERSGHPAHHKPDNTPIEEDTTDAWHIT